MRTCESPNVLRKSTSSAGAAATAGSGGRMACSASRMTVGSGSGGRESPSKAISGTGGSLPASIHRAASGVMTSGSRSRSVVGPSSDRRAERGSSPSTSDASGGISGSGTGSGWSGSPAISIGGIGLSSSCWPMFASLLRLSSPPKPPTVVGGAVPGAISSISAPSSGDEKSSTSGSGVNSSGSGRGSDSCSSSSGSSSANSSSRLSSGRLAPGSQPSSSSAASSQPTSGTSSATSASFTSSWLSQVSCASGSLITICGSIIGFASAATRLKLSSSMWVGSRTSRLSSISMRRVLVMRTPREWSTRSRRWRMTRLAWPPVSSSRLSMTCSGGAQRTLDDKAILR